MVHLLDHRQSVVIETVYRPEQRIGSPYRFLLYLSDTIQLLPNFSELVLSCSLLFRVGRLTTQAIGLLLKALVFTHLKASEFGTYQLTSGLAEAERAGRPTQSRSERFTPCQLLSTRTSSLVDSIFNYF